MKYYYRRYDEKYLKVVVDNNHTGTDSDPDEVVDAYWISGEEYNKDCEELNAIIRSYS